MLKKEFDEEKRELTEEEKRFIDREMKLQNLDSLLLFLASILGFLFSFIYVLFGYLEVALAFIPVIILGLVIPIYVGYIRGGIILDTLEERVRGWIYFIAGVVVYLLQGIVWLLEQMLLKTPSPHGNLLTGFMTALGPFFVGWLIGTGKLTHWISNSIFEVFDQKITTLTEKIFDDTTESAFYASIYLFFSFSLYMTRVPYIELFTIFVIASAVLSVLWYERDIRKFVKLSQYSRFLNVERQRTKPRIPFTFAHIGVLFLLLGTFLIVGIVPMVQTPLSLTLSLICVVIIPTGFMLLFLSRSRYIFRASRKKMDIPEEVERELTKLIGPPEKIEEGKKRLRSLADNARPEECSPA